VLHTSHIHNTSQLYSAYTTIACVCHGDLPLAVADCIVGSRPQRHEGLQLPTATRAAIATSIPMSNILQDLHCTMLWGVGPKQQALDQRQTTAGPCSAHLAQYALLPAALLTGALPSPTTQKKARTSQPPALAAVPHLSQTT
jgi:hypothetical protein